MRKRFPRWLTLLAVLVVLVAALGTTVSAAGNPTEEPGSKMIVCADCNETGLCMTCYGQDPVCSDCGGTFLCSACGGTGYVESPSHFYNTVWGLLPPVIAIALALITKEVYSSLLAGCVMGALLAEGFAPWRSFETLFLTLMEGIDRKIFFFDVLLGAIVVLFARSGGSRAFGEWASRRVRSRRGAETATATLGCLIFLDDYFNCLTVGAIMQPIADRFRISREKLAFLIDATAAPVCIIAPISSWAAAVSSYIPAEYAGTVNGFTLFLRAIPYNFYALLMLWMVCLLYTSDAADEL